MELRGSRVLVTGVGGFVGAHLARALVARGADVWGTGVEAGSTPAPVHEGTVSAYSAGVDLSSADAAERLIAWASPNAIVHLAGQSSAARSFEAPVETFAANVLGTWNLLAAVGAGVPRARVLVVGSGEVYGPLDPGSRAGEESPMRPVSPYALSKAVADRLAGRLGQTHDIDVVRSRSFGHTGPGQTPRFVVPAFAQQIAAIERGESEPVLRVGNLDVIRDLSDVRDVVEGYALLLERGQRGAAYNVCRGEGVRLADLAARLVALARRPVRIEPDPARQRPADVPYLVGDPTSIARDCGWSARRPIEQTIEDVLAEWRA